MAERTIRSALISVFSKEGLAPIIEELAKLGVVIYSTGGTKKYIEQLNAPVTAVEEVTSYPSILDGRVKTLHPKVFGGILARREKGHLDELGNYEIPEIDLVIVDLYPFEDTVAQTNEEDEIIEKIDIGGISLIRAAAKNYKDVLVVPSKDQYPVLLEILQSGKGKTSLEERKNFATAAFNISSHYDTAIFQHFVRGTQAKAFKKSVQKVQTLRYGENPHQQAQFFGDLEQMFDKLHGKELSYNNLVDIDAAVSLMTEFKNAQPTFAVLKHTNACGTATRPSLLEAWKAALAGDPVSAFGGILICNKELDPFTAAEINKLFFEVIIAPEYTDEALDILKQKKNRIILVIKKFGVQKQSFKSLLNGVIAQDADIKIEKADDLKTVTERSPSPREVSDLLFANTCAKHLKSNTIALVKDHQLIGMGCGQTSRVDALKQAIVKAKAFGFDLSGAVMASDAFFPFNDCVDIAQQEGITAVVQPGGSIRDQDSIDKCNEHGVAMVITGVRHFKH